MAFGIRQKILDVSKTFFYDTGYENTSTKMIAKEVGIAEGTVFNYFPSKTDILFESIYDNYIDNAEKYKEIFDLEENITEVILGYLQTSLSLMLKIPRTILSEVAIQALKLARKTPSRFKKMAELDIKYIKELEQYFIKLIDKEILCEVDSKQLSEIVYGSIIFEIMMFLYDKSISKTDLTDRIKLKINTIIKGYIKGGTKDEY